MWQAKQYLALLTLSNFYLGNNVTNTLLDFDSVSSVALAVQSATAIAATALGMNDVFNIGTSRPTIYLGSGTNTLNAGAMAGSYYGSTVSSATDTFIAGSAAATFTGNTKTGSSDTFYLGSGNDTFTNGAGTNTYNLANVVNNTGVVISEATIGSNANFTVSGAVSDTINGGTITGGNTIYLGSGNNTVNGGNVGFTAYGGSGAGTTNVFNAFDVSDTFVGGSGATNIFNATTIPGSIGSLFTGSNAGTNTFVEGGAAFDQFNAQTGATNILQTNQAGAIVLDKNWMITNHTLIGGYPYTGSTSSTIAKMDTISSTNLVAPGSSTIYNGFEYDTAQKNLSNDTIETVFNNINEVNANVPSSSSTVLAASTLYITGSNNSDTINAAGGIKYEIFEGDGNDVISISSSGASTLKAGNGNDIIYATGSGNYSITSGTGTDTWNLSGTGHSTLVASSGNGVLNISGSGSDSVTLGGGSTGINTVSITGSANVTLQDNHAYLTNSTTAGAVTISLNTTGVEDINVGDVAYSAVHYVSGLITGTVGGGSTIDSIGGGDAAGQTAAAPLEVSVTQFQWKCGDYCC